MVARRVQLAARCDLSLGMRQRVLMEGNDDANSIEYTWQHVYCVFFGNAVFQRDDIETYVMQW